MSRSTTPCGGDDRTRTDDPLLAKQVLYQLSYVPALTGADDPPLTHTASADHNPPPARRAEAVSSSAARTTAPVIGTSVEDLIARFLRSLRAENTPPRTVGTHGQAWRYPR